MKAYDGNNFRFLKTPMNSEGRETNLSFWKTIEKREGGEFRMAEC